MKKKTKKKKKKWAERGQNCFLSVCLCELGTGLNQAGFDLSEGETMTSSLKCLLTVEIHESVKRSFSAAGSKHLMWVQAICRKKLLEMRKTALATFCSSVRKIRNG